MSNGSKFEILCVTMHQNDFSKLQHMNVHSDIVFANQCDRTEYEECEFGDHKAKMISTVTKGVGKNRNLSLMYASADICMFADDDVVYHDDAEERVLAEFEEHPDADIIIFHFDTDSERKQIKYKKTKKCGMFTRMPWAGFRIAFRLRSVLTANLFFTTLYGGGCVFPSGEDSMWLNEAKRKGLTFYVSKETIGRVSFETSTWFTGHDEKYFFAKGAYYSNVHPKTIWLWKLYFAFRTKNMGEMSFVEKMKWLEHGEEAYLKLQSYEEFCKDNGLT